MCFDSEGTKKKSYTDKLSVYTLLWRLVYLSTSRSKEAASLYLCFTQQNVHLKISPIKTVSKGRSWNDVQVLLQCRQKNVQHCVTEVPGPKFILVFGVPRALSGLLKSCHFNGELLPWFTWEKYLCSCVNAALCACWRHSLLASICVFQLGGVTYYTVVENCGNNLCWKLVIGYNPAYIYIFILTCYLTYTVPDWLKK